MSNLWKFYVNILSLSQVKQYGVPELIFYQAPPRFHAGFCLDFLLFEFKFKFKFKLSIIA